MTAFQKMTMVREGISKKDLESLKSKANLDYDKLSILLSTTRATLINKKGSEIFSAALSERIVSIADLYSYGFEVFEDKSKFNKWVITPNKALGGKLPFELLDNQFGREEVKNVIGRIDYGVYS
ncbi:MAG: MbcA/ParS/Xre antitoxin family protein [Ferruginibacter sp.]